MLVERRVALRAERRDTEGHRQDLGELADEARAFVDVGVGLSRNAHHQVELHAIHPDLLRAFDGSDVVLLSSPPLDDVAHTLARSIEGRRQRAMTRRPERGDELLLEAIGPKTRQADLHPALAQSPNDIHDFRVITDRCANEPHSARVSGDRVEHDLFRDDRAFRRSSSDA